MGVDEPSAPRGASISLPEQRLANHEHNENDRDVSHGAPEMGVRIGLGRPRRPLPRADLDVLPIYESSSSDDLESVLLTVGAGHAVDHSGDLQWIHHSRPAQDFSFDHFMRVVRDVPGLSQHEYEAAVRCLRKVKEFRKTCARGWYFDPLTYDHQEVINVDGVHKPLAVSFSSTPVLALQPPTSVTSRKHDKESGNARRMISSRSWFSRTNRAETRLYKRPPFPSENEMAGKQSSAEAPHPVRTLMQYANVLTADDARDWQQALVRLGGVDQSTEFIHLPELWALVINKYTLVTCTTLTAAQLRCPTIQTQPVAPEDQGISVQYTAFNGEVHSFRCRTFIGMSNHLASIEHQDDVSLAMTNTNSPWVVIDSQFLRMDRPRWKLLTQKPGYLDALVLRLIRPKSGSYLGVHFAKRKFLQACKVNRAMLWLRSRIDDLEIFATNLSSDVASHDLDAKIAELTSKHDAHKRNEIRIRLLLAASRYSLIHPGPEEATKRSQASQDAADFLEYEEPPQLHHFRPSSLVSVKHDMNWDSLKELHLMGFDVARSSAALRSWTSTRPPFDSHISEPASTGVKASPDVSQQHIAVENEVALSEIDEATDTGRVRTYAIRDMGTLLLFVHMNAFAQLILNPQKGGRDLKDVYRRLTAVCHERAYKDGSLRTYEDAQLLREELDVIVQVFRAQKDVSRRLIQQRGGTVTDMDRLVHQRTIKSLEDTIQYFKDLRSFADEALIFREKCMRTSTEDNNNTVIHIFTAVTLVFLPLSFASALVGMNKADIRSTSNNSKPFWELLFWELSFWALSQSLTLVVGVLCCISLLRSFNSGRHVFGQLLPQALWLKGFDSSLFATLAASRGRRASEGPETVRQIKIKPQIITENNLSDRQGPREKPVDVDIEERAQRSDGMNSGSCRLFEVGQCFPTRADRIKTMVETWIGHKLIWWPLKEPLRPLTPGQHRYGCECECGDLFTVHLADNKLLEEHHHAELSSSGRSSFGRDVQLLPFHSLASGQQPTPSATSAGRGSATGNSLPRNGQQKIVNSTPSLSTASSLEMTKSTTSNGFVYWCVASDSVLAQLAELDTKDLTGDCLVKWMLQKYSAITGRWYRFWTMTSCAGVTFKRFRYLYDDQYLVATSNKPELPCSPDYEYIKRDPLEDYRRWLEARVSHCMLNHSCGKWPWWTRKSSCTSCDRLLRHIPTRMPLRLEMREFNEGFGMEAISRHAVWRVLLFLCFWLSGGAAFLVFWLIHHPDDLQTATVILLTIVAAFPIYLQVILKTAKCT